MNEEIIEQLGKFAWGVARQTLESTFKRDLEIERDAHPSENAGRHVGHAIGRTAARLLDPFGSDQSG